jgi:preprotein translocase subunit YajC
MKVKELIEKLQEYDPELMVIRSGYEGGVAKVTHAEFVTIALNVNTSWYYGEHEVVYGDDTYEGHELAVAIYIN